MDPGRPKEQLDPSALGRCESCNALQEWHIVEGTYALIPVHNGRLVLHGPLMLPSVRLAACKQCGHIRLYSVDHYD